MVLHHSRAKGTEKVILLGIANHQGDGGAWPAVATLARYANADRRTVQRAIRALQEAGELEVETRREGLSNRYVVTVQCPPWCDRSMGHRVVEDFIHRGGTHAAPLGGGTHAAPDTHAAPGGDAHAAPPAAPTPPEPSMNPTLNRGGSRPALPTDRAREEAIRLARAALQQATSPTTTTGEIAHA